MSVIDARGPFVRDLPSAIDAYWTASNPREQQAAYHEILLFGGNDGYPNNGRIRTAIAKWLRQMALWVDRA